MAKIESLAALTSLTNQTSAINTINENMDKIETALANTLSRDGSAPNSMSFNFDMNSNRILNLPAPVSDHEPARKADLDAYTLGLTPAQLTEAIEAVDEVLAARDEAVAAAADAEESAEDAAGYIGSATSAQTWTTARNFTIAGDATSSPVSVDGSANVTITVALANDTVSNDELTAGAAVANIGYTPANKAGETFTGDVTFNEEVFCLKEVTLPTGLSALNQYSAGWRAAPIVTQDADVTFPMDASAKVYRHTSGSSHTFTIPPNSTTAFPIGTVIVVRNVGSGGVILARGSGVALRIAGNSTDSNKTVAQWGYVSLLKEDTDTWVVTGAGVS